MPELEDGTFDFSLGQDSWRNPKSIRENQYARGVNVKTRDGRVSPRSGFHHRELIFEEKTFPTGKYQIERTYKELFEGGKFQALIPFAREPDHYLIWVISGLIWRTNVKNGKTILLSTDVKLDQYVARVNWSFADDKVVLFDYPARPIIIDGEEVRRSTVVDREIPVSTLGTYNGNRLFIANAGAEFTASDPVGSISTPDAPITFNEILLPNTGFTNQVFSLPVEEATYPITAMGFLQALDSSTGIGPLFVATEQKLYHYATNQPRENWTKQQFGSVLLAKTGIAGARAFINVNSDLIFMTPEGQVHALSTARNEAKKWGNVSISREVEKYLKFSDVDLSKFAVLGYFDNFIFISANPFRIKAQDRDGRIVTDYAHGGFVVLEIESLASFLAEGTPVWDGLWTGVQPMEIATVGKRCFVASKDGCDTIGGQNVLYEVKSDSTYDIARNTLRRVQSIVYLREYDFKKPFSHKREGSLLVHLEDLQGQIDLIVDRKPAHAHKFLHYDSWSHFAPSYFSESMPPDEYLLGVAPQQIKQIVFGEGEHADEADPVTGELYGTYRSVQLRLTILGENWSLDEVKMKVTEELIPERFDSELRSLPVVALPLQHEPDWDLPEENLCQLPS